MGLFLLGVVAGLLIGFIIGHISAIVAATETVVKSSKFIAEMKADYAAACKKVEDDAAKFFADAKVDGNRILDASGATQKRIFRG